MWNFELSSEGALFSLNAQRVAAFGEALCCDVQDVIDCNASIAHIQAVGIKNHDLKVCWTICADQNGAIIVDLRMKDRSQEPISFG